MDERIDQKIENSLKLIAKTSIIVFIGLFLSRLFSYIYRVIIARQFGPEEYGLLSLSIVILGLSVAVSSMGVGDGLIRFIPMLRARNENEKIKYTIRWAFAVMLVSGIILGITLFLLSHYISIEIFHNEKLIIYLEFFSILVPISILGNSFLEVLRAYEHIQWYSFIFNILQNAIKLMLLIFLTIFGLFNSNSIIFSYILGVSSILIAGFLVCKKKIKLIFKKDNLGQTERRQLRTEMLSYSTPLVFSAIISILLYWADSISLGYLIDATAVGFYNAAVPIALLISFVPETFMQLFRPLINKEFGRNDLKTVEEISKQVAKWIFIFVVPMFILIFIFPGAAIKIFFGESFLVAETALRILLLGAVILAMASVPNNLILMKGKSGVMFFDMFLSTLVNFILNLVLIPLPRILSFDNNYGLVGAACATSISAIFLGILLFVQAKKYTQIIPLRRKMIMIVLVAVISLAILVFIKQFISMNLINIILLSISFGLTYVLLLFLTKSLDENDYLVIKSILRKVSGKNTKINSLSS